MRGIRGTLSIGWPLVLHLHICEWRLEGDWTRLSASVTPLLSAACTWAWITTQNIVTGGQIAQNKQARDIRLNGIERSME